MDLKDKSVRGTGKTHNLRPQYVLSAVKEGKTDEEIQFEELFYEGLIQYRLDTGNALWYANLSAEAIDKYNTARKNGLEHTEAIACTALNTEQLGVYYEVLHKYSKYAEKMSQDMFTQEN